MARASQDADWSAMGISDIMAVLDRGITAIELGNELNRNELKLLFAPTGALQETSLSNGWAEEFLSLSGQFDRLIS